MGRPIHPPQLHPLPTRDPRFASAAAAPQLRRRRAHPPSEPASADPVPLFRRRATPGLDPRSPSRRSPRSVPSSVGARLGRPRPALPPPRHPRTGSMVAVRRVVGTPVAVTRVAVTPVAQIRLQAEPPPCRDTPPRATCTPAARCASRPGRRHAGAPLRRPGSNAALGHLRMSSTPGRWRASTPSWVGSPPRAHEGATFLATALTAVKQPLQEPRRRKRAGDSRAYKSSAWTC